MWSWCNIRFLQTIGNSFRLLIATLLAGVPKILQCFSVQAEGSLRGKGTTFCTFTFAQISFHHADMGQVLTHRLIAKLRIIVTYIKLTSLAQRKSG